MVQGRGVESRGRRGLLARRRGWHAACSPWLFACTLWPPCSNSSHALLPPVLGGLTAAAKDVAAAQRSRRVMQELRALGHLGGGCAAIRSQVKHLSRPDPRVGGEWGSSKLATGSKEAAAHELQHGTSILRPCWAHPGKAPVGAGPFPPLLPPAARWPGCACTGCAAGRRCKCPPGLQQGRTSGVEAVSRPGRGVGQGAALCWRRSVAPAHSLHTTAVTCSMRPGSGHICAPEGDPNRKEGKKDGSSWRRPPVWQTCGRREAGAALCGWRMCPAGRKKESAAAALATC